MFSSLSFICGDTEQNIPFSSTNLLREFGCTALAVKMLSTPDPYFLQHPTSKLVSTSVTTLPLPCGMHTHEALTT